MGTFIVNVLGSFVLGLITFVNLDNSVALLLGTGMCGSFTTFSSFSVETVRLWEIGRRPQAIGNALGTLVGSGIALAIAWGVALYL